MAHLPAFLVVPEYPGKGTERRGALAGKFHAKLTALLYLPC